MTADILALLHAAAARYGLDPDLVVAVAQQESGGNPRAVSSAGAEGVMQLMPATAAQLGVTDPFDPAQNIDGGVRYLSQLISEFNGDTALALAAYNWGPGNVSKHGLSNWPAETQNYVSSILSSIGGVASTVEATFTGAIEPADPAAPGGTPGGGGFLAMAIFGALALWFASEVFG